MYEWTDKMKNVGATPALETATRTAVAKAVEYLSTLPDGAEQPRWTIGHVAVPANDAAEKMFTVITMHLDGSLTGRALQTIVATAVGAALFACNEGRKGDEAWAALVSRLSKK